MKLYILISSVFCAYNSYALNIDTATHPYFPKTTITSIEYSDTSHTAEDLPIDSSSPISYPGAIDSIIRYNSTYGYDIVSTKNTSDGVTYTLSNHVEEMASIHPLYGVKCGNGESASELFNNEGFFCKKSDADDTLIIMQS